MDFDNVVKDKVIEVLDEKANILLHCNVRNNNTIIVNSHINDRWDKEIRINKEFKGKHIIKILAKNDYFKILDNNKLVTFLLQKNISKSSYININDNVKEFIYKVM